MYNSLDIDSGQRCRYQPSKFQGPVGVLTLVGEGACPCLQSWWGAQRDTSDVQRTPLVSSFRGFSWQKMQDGEWLN